MFPGNYPPVRGSFLSDTATRLVTFGAPFPRIVDEDHGLPPYGFDRETNERIRSRISR